jgi:rRNA maturation RNase YbeY
MSKINFHSTDKPFVFPQKRKLKLFLEDIFKKEKKKIQQLDYIFCSDEYLLQINQQFLQHDYYTDIITFDLSETKSVTYGEIYISLDRVKDNAIQIKSSYKTELLRVIIHGILHLCGYKDKTKAQKQEMREKEEFYLSSFSKTEA